MNQNESDRYYWRTGQRWSADNSPNRMRPAGRTIRKGVIALLFTAFVLTVVTLYVLQQIGR